ANFRGDAMISGQLDAVIPMLCVALAGLVVLLAEAFRDRGEKMPIGGLAIIGLVGALITSAPWPGFLTQMLGGNPSLWDRNATSFGVVTADNFSLFVVSVL